MEKVAVTGLSNTENRRVWRRMVLLAQHCYKKVDQRGTEKRKKVAREVHLERIKASAMSALEEVPRIVTQKR